MPISFTDLPDKTIGLVMEHLEDEHPTLENLNLTSRRPSNLSFAKLWETFSVEVREGTLKALGRAQERLLKVSAEPRLCNLIRYLRCEEYWVREREGETEDDNEDRDSEANKAANTGFYRAVSKLKQGLPGLSNIYIRPLSFNHLADDDFQLLFASLFQSSSFSLDIDGTHTFSIADLNALALPAVSVSNIRKLRFVCEQHFPDSLGLLSNLQNLQELTLRNVAGHAADDLRAYRWELLDPNPSFGLGIRRLELKYLYSGQLAWLGGCIRSSRRRSKGKADLLPWNLEYLDVCFFDGRGDFLDELDFLSTFGTPSLTQLTISIGASALTDTFIAQLAVESPGLKALTLNNEQWFGEDEKENLVRPCFGLTI